MRRVIVVILSFLFIGFVCSCNQVENPEYEIVKKISEFKDSSVSSFMFVINDVSKEIESNSYEDALDKSDYILNESKTIIKYDKKKDVLLYYKYLVEDNNVTRNFLSYVLYDKKINKYIITNSNSMTYRVSNYDSIEAIFEEKLNYKFDTYIYNTMNNIFDDSNNSKDEYNIEYLYNNYRNGFKIESKESYRFINKYWRFENLSYEYYEYVDSITLPNLEDYIEYPSK